MTQVEIAVTRLPHNADLSLPAYETAQSAGMDLAAAIDAPMTLRRASAPWCRPVSQ
jgi:dUTP pyrophosphatase